MSDAQFVVRSGRNYSAGQVGTWAELGNYVMTHPRIPGKIRGKLFLRDALGLTGMEVSLGIIPAGRQVPFYHKHRKNEELYLVVKGTGEFQVDGEVIDLREGTAIRVALEGSRTLRAHTDGDLHYIVIQAREKTLEDGTINDGIPIEEKVQWPAAPAR